MMWVLVLQKTYASKCATLETYAQKFAIFAYWKSAFKNNGAKQIVSDLKKYLDERN